MKNLTFNFNSNTTADVLAGLASDLHEFKNSYGVVGAIGGKQLTDDIRDRINYLATFSTADNYTSASMAQAIVGGKYSVNVDESEDALF